MNGTSLEIRAEDLELQNLLNETKRESDLATPTLAANDAADDANEDEELLLKKQHAPQEPANLPWLQLLFYLVMRASS